MLLPSDCVWVPAWRPAGGPHVDVVHDPGWDVQHSYGLSDLVGFAFIGSDGLVHRVFNKAPTDQQLEDALDALQ